MKTPLLSAAIFIAHICSSFAQHTTSGLFDIQNNSHGNIAVTLTNYGLAGANGGAAFWKRGTTNQYIFGGGMWFGAKKDVDMKPNQKLVVISFNPNTGTSWMSPTVDSACKNHHDSVRYARLYFSTDFANNGTPATVADGFGFYNWPIFKKDSQHPFGEFVADPALRTASSGSPYVVSNEDVICAYNDGNLSRYDNGDSVRRSQGYPLGISIVQRTYFFDNIPLKDVMIQRFEITHTGADTLRQCWFAPAMDFDIGSGGGVNAAENDNLHYYDSDTTIGLVFGWTKATAKDAGKGLGYIGFTFLETPAVDELGYQTTTASQELGLKTYRNWTGSNDPLNDAERYDFISTGIKDGDTGYGDKRMIAATGPFHLRPNETVVMCFAVMFAATASGNDATGTNDDATNIIQLCRDTKNAYTQFRSNGIPLDAGEQSPAGVENSSSLYPNPTSGISTVEYTLTAASRVKIDVVDVLSHTTIGLIEAGEKQAGTYRAVMNTQSLAAGIYYCRIDIGGQVTWKKLSVIK